MQIQILEKNGVALIKDQMDKQIYHQELWKLLLIDCAKITQYIDVEDIMHSLTKKLLNREGKITKSSSSMVMLLVRLNPNEGFESLLEKINSILPAEFACSISKEESSVEPTEEIEKITLILGYGKGLSQAMQHGYSGELFQARLAREEKRVLIADDDMFIRQLLKTNLKEKFKVIEAETGDAVEKLYSEHQPDILLLDIHMPGKSGLEVIDDIFQNDPDAYIIIMSADSVQENVLEAVKKGAKGFLAKPPQKEHLLKYIEKCPSLKKV